MDIIFLMVMFFSLGPRIQASSVRYLDSKLRVSLIFMVVVIEVQYFSKMGVSTAVTMDTRMYTVAGAFLEIEAGGAQCTDGRAAEIYAPALIRPHVFCCTVVANADCACSIGRGRDL